MHNINLDMSREMLWTLLDQVTDATGQLRFPRGHYLTLTDLLDFMFNERNSDGLNVEEKQPLATTSTTTSTCTQCGYTSTHSHTLHIITLKADLLHQSPVDITDLLHYHFNDTGFLSTTCSQLRFNGTRCGGAVVKINRLTNIADVLLLTVGYVEGYLVSCKRAMEIAGRHYRLKGVGYHQPDVAQGHFVALVERDSRWWMADGTKGQCHDSQDHWALASRIRLAAGGNNFFYPDCNTVVAMYVCVGV